MAEILIKAISISNADPSKDRSGCYKRGMPVQVLPDGSYLTELNNPNSKMLPPTFYWLLIPDLTTEQTETLKEEMSRSWNIEINYEILSSNNTTGTYQLRIFNEKMEWYQ
jgi:hypothetical protein